ncbi:MAG: S41 family peptidase [Candidatus Omnitrophica bacterium]|nr:S41 family peptidase [Candidatus Omnitrophota bacterium]
MRKNIIVIFLLVLLFAGATRVFSDNDKKKKDELYRQVGLFADTLAIIDKHYVDETKPKDLIYGSLKGMLSSLDPHSQFLNPDDYSELKEETEGKFGGLGIEITVKDGLLTVITPIEDTPAWKAGIKPGDYIVKINGDLTRDMTLMDAVKKMRGKPGGTVDLTILRNSEKKLLDFKITRDMIKIKDIKQARILEGNIGYIRLVEFRENTLQEFNKALTNLSKQKMEALIIDLRNNPGGLLDVAVKITGRFIPADKMVVYTKGRQKEQNLEFLSDSKDAITDIPMAVLINEGSASGSEIVAGALQDYKRAMIIGTKSFGKGSVQTLIPLSDGSALRLTTSHYFTPSGKIIHEKGVTPDIEVQEQKENEAKEGEAKEKKPNEIFDEITNKEMKSKTGADEFDYSSDIQLKRAVETLKAIKIYKDLNQEKQK